MAAMAGVCVCVRAFIPLSSLHFYGASKYVF